MKQFFALAIVVLAGCTSHVGYTPEDADAVYTGRLYIRTGGVQSYVDDAIASVIRNDTGDSFVHVFLNGCSIPVSHDEGFYLHNEIICDGQRVFRVTGYDYPEETVPSAEILVMMSDRTWDFLGHPAATDTR